MEVADQLTSIFKEPPQKTAIVATIFKLVLLRSSGFPGLWTYSSIQQAILKLSSWWNIRHPSWLDSLKMSQNAGDNKIKCSCIHHSWWMHFSIEHLCYTPPIEYWMNSYTCILSRIFQWLPSRDGVAPGGTNVLRRPDTFSQAMHWKTSQEGSTSYIYKWWNGMSWI